MSTTPEYAPGIRALLYTEELNGRQVCRDDLWLATTAALDALRNQINAELLQELRNIANADTVAWDDRTEFEAWAKSRARAAIAKVTSDNPAPLSPAWCSSVDAELDETAAADAAMPVQMLGDEPDPMAEECERLQNALAFWLPQVPPADHPLHARIANDAYLLFGVDGPNTEPSAYEQGFVDLLSHPKSIAATDERTPQDYALEHAEYMAKDAENLLEAHNEVYAAEQRSEDMDGNEGEEFVQSAGILLDQARSDLSEAIRAMRSGIYEFRKRRDRAAAAAVPAPGASFGIPADRIALLLKHSMKPEEIAGEPGVQHSRVAEIISWMARLTEGNANPKWLHEHAFELAYYIASNGVNRQIDMSVATSDSFAQGFNVSAEDRAMLTRINPEKFPPQAAPVAQLSEPPEGWKLVPIEPTENMKYAAVDAAPLIIRNHLNGKFTGVVTSLSSDMFGECYAAMLAAAPTTPKDAA